jgi:hypothetical protein
VTAEGLLEIRNIRHHEAKLGIGIGELALQIQEIRARYVPSFKGVPPGYGDIGNAAAFGLIFEVGRTIEQAQVGLAQNISEFRRRDEPVMPRHCWPPIVLGHAKDRIGP